MKTILFKFSGPMQSWGTSSHFETRNTDYYPSKSAVIGVIAASFGYRRDEDEKIEKLNELDFAVRVDQVGLLRKDYQTARKLKKDESYVTNRYYLEDAIFIVAISSEDDKWVEEIYYALKNPYFQPFMGRRSYPVQPDFIIDVVEMGAIEALENLEWQASDWYKRRNKNYVADIYADKDLIPESGYTMRNDMVNSFSQKERKFGPRFEARTAKRMSTEDEANKSESEQFDCYGALEE